MKSRAFIKRLIQYQKERFPVLQYILLIFFFYYGFYGISKHFKGSKLTFTMESVIGAITVLLIFFQLRLFDEIKDNEIDSKYMPERAVPRGLISLKEIMIMLIVVTIMMFLLNLFFGLSNLIVFTLMELYIFLMGKEFFMSEQLKKNRLIYASLHMVAMSWIGFYVIQQAVGVSSLRLQHILLIIISYITGFTMEIARKTEAPQNEREGVDTYSKLVGYKVSVFLVITLSVVSVLILLWMFGFDMYAGIIVSFLAIPIAGAVVFLAKMNKTGSKILENSASVYTLAIVVFFFIIAARNL